MPDKVQRPYWASLPPDQIAKELTQRYEDYTKFTTTSGVEKAWDICQEKYFRGIQRPGMFKVGKRGQYSALWVNEFRNHLKHLASIITSQRPNFSARAVNTDKKSQSQTILANALLEYYMGEKKVEVHLKKAVEHALLFGEGFLAVTWDTSQGEDLQVVEIDVPGEAPSEGVRKTGDVVFRNFQPYQVARELSREGDAQQNWYILNTQANRFDLAAKYPELADRIMALAPVDENDGLLTEVFRLLGTVEKTNSDDVQVLEFYHAKTEALPKGRIVTILGDDIVIQNGDLQYEELPIYRITPAEMLGQPFGYSVALDLLGLQEMYDIGFSTIATNQRNFGVQNVTVTRDAGLKNKRYEGLNVLEHSPGTEPPKALNLTQTAPEQFKFLDVVKKEMEIISGVNSVVRGDPQKSLESGAALALVQNQTIQFSSDLQQSYVQLLENVGSAIIALLRAFGHERRTAAITGITNQQYLREFSKEDLEFVARVSVDLGNPMLRTVAGKVNLADQLGKLGLIENADQFIQVVETGNLNPLIEGKRSELLLIRDENEVMSRGEPVQVMATDNHAQHVLEHKSVLATAEVREPLPEGVEPNETQALNAQIQKVVTDHILEHIQTFKDLDPILLALLGQTPPPPEAPEGGGPPDGQSLPGGIAEGGPDVGGGLDATAPVTAQAAGVQLPNNPVNPATGLETSGIVGQEPGDI